MLVQLPVQVSQAGVEVVQFRLYALVLFMVLVKLPFVVQALLLVHDGREVPDEEKVKDQH